MKLKSFLLVILVVLCLIPAAACNDAPAGPPEPEKESALDILQEEIRDSGSILGAAFIGYIADKETDEDVMSFLDSSAYADKYPFLCQKQACSFVSYEGDELYALVPADDTCSILICGTTLTETCEYIDEPDNVIFEGRPGEAVLLRCNFSDIYSNTVIYATDGSDKYTFHPGVSLNDSTVAMEDGYYDFTLPAASGQSDTEIASELLRERAKVKQGLEQGMKLLYLDEKQEINGVDCMLFAMGTDHSDHFVREELFAVSDNIVYIYDAVDDKWTLMDN